MTTATHIHPAHMARMLSTAGLHHLSASPLHALCVIAAVDGSTTMTAIAHKLGITTAAITGTVDRLEAAGFITRNGSRMDRRVIYVHLTEKGTAALDDILNA